MSDGAGIYTLGKRNVVMENGEEVHQGDLIEGNYVNVDPPAKSGGYAAFYGDQGSNGGIVTNNVANTPTTILHGWLQLAYDGTLTRFSATENFSTVATVWSKAIADTCSEGDDVSNKVKKVYVNTTTVSPPPASWPAAAQTIINNAGLEPGY